MIGLICRTVGIPQNVPLLVPKLRPAGRLPLISQEVITPEPVSVGASGKSPLAVLLARVRFSGEYDNVGTVSITSIVMVVVFTPPEFRAVIV